MSQYVGSLFYVKSTYPHVRNVFSRVLFICRAVQSIGTVCNLERSLSPCQGCWKKHCC